MLWVWGPEPAAALHVQFGQAFARRDHFRQQFRHTLELALSVYPAAKVETHEKGITLLPSPPPVAKAPKLVALLGRTSALPGLTKSQAGRCSR